MYGFVAGGAALSQIQLSRARTCARSGPLRMVQESGTSTKANLNTKEVRKDVIKSGVNVNETGAGVFGFTAFAEQWNGRMAMLGLVAAVAQELRTGQGVIKQLGLSDSQGYVLVFVMLGFSLFASLGYITVKKGEQMDAAMGKDNRGENF
eukprot:CAMPEP_0185833814 /NCGR_PEP_ID=MMETSP1353-20130828/3532_1 /TAXON_ID=1077150 /ORGANISM="Erythrolobus australicus, Strain CCMP3124" /LENGTH=149 /DNA_ID=CAMNT_0028532143 /DNA_START=40 /DNA_END=489 /DNA_ORIENTATION=+